VKLRIAVAILFATGVASADPGTQPHDLDGTNPPESTDAKCRSCHSGGTDDDGKYFRPWDTWAGTMMSQAARDPLFLAALTVAEQDSAGIGIVCWRCHSPQGFVKGNASGLGTMLDDDDKEGVACDACHRSVDPSMTMPVLDPKGPYAGNGYLFWDPGLAKHGPYNDADSPAHTTIADPFTSSAKLCGQCHELANPRVNMKDMNGADTGKPFPLDTTYTEWSASAFASGADAKSCIDCHMRKATGDVQLSSFASAKTRSSPRTHFLVAANVWGMDAVRAAEPALASMRTLAFDTAKTEALATLKTALKVEITGAPAMAARGDAVMATVRVTNLTGHKFPTGYADGRRGTLRVQLLDGMTSVASVDARIYETVQEEFMPKREWHIALSDVITKDTRIPPKGFVPGPTTPIIGATFGDGFDDVPVMLSVPADLSPEAGTLTLVATVLYQSTVPEMIDELAAANKTDMRGQTLKIVYAATGNGAPIPIATAQASFTIPPNAMMKNPPPPPMKSGCSCNESASALNGWPMLFALALLTRRRRAAG
jgi:uncharacterized protein (TIGR03382 family)